MFKKRAKSTRTKINEEEISIDTGSSIPDVNSEIEKDQKKIVKGKTKEEQEEAFKITKSAASRRLTKSKSKKLHLDHKPIPQNSDPIIASSYTEEILSELRANTPATPASFQSQDNLGEKFPLTLDPNFDIPDAGAINAAKKEREMRRKKGLSSILDYIPLSEDTDVIASSGKKMESRLVREEDELGEADEELEQYLNEKLAIGKKAKREQERLKKEDIEEMIMDVNFEEEDVELLQREFEAMKAGGHNPKKSSKRKFDKTQPIVRARIPIIVHVPTLNEVQSSLESQLMDLQVMHSNHQAELIQIQKDIDNLTSSNAQIEIEMQNTKNRYNYFQDLKTFVENLVEFLDDKFPTLEELENDYLEVLTKKSQLILQRIMEEDSDDIAVFANISIKDDLSCEQRQQRRHYRRQIRYSYRPEEINEEGFSTDEELYDKEIEKEIYGKIDEISYKRTSLFDDVIEEFKSIALVKSKFVSWKTEFNNDYTKAYGGLSLPGVFEFYVRYEMMLCNALKINDINDMEWYKVISEYSAESSKNQMETDDEDFTVLTKVLEKIVLPRIVHLMKTLNPYSSRQTKSLVDFLKKTLKYVDSNSQRFQEIIITVSARLQNVVESLEIIPENINIKLSDLNDSSSVTRNRYFCRKYKLLKSLIMWKEFVPIDIIRSLSIDHLLNRYLLHILKNSSLKTDREKYQKILETIPSDWLHSSTLETIARGAAGY
ncbi:13410_t:CDS:10 [Funneliformis geosporum]|uniref:5126_t:CDS:1 n=1 Tax=Funneliformis geosporum TaxID=1117311 RepID=A0A9W4WJ81_9GLOM|nr:13410_t:CDS:10 [Funneliformis geosporum]CAI2165746.1 5126_t:CDS:10 [Funneliformis geosporum]